MGKTASAAANALAIMGATYYVMSSVHMELETHFHLLHPQAEDTAEMRRHPFMLFGFIALFPLTMVVAFLLLVPLMAYCTDHAPFQNLNLWLPQHYLRLLYKFYRACLTESKNGKLSGKDL